MGQLGTVRQAIAPMSILKAPRRSIRYLTSEGIHPREVKGLTQLDADLPAEWTFYAGLQYFPGQDTPIEMDLIVLMDDRVLLVEIKDWTKKIRSTGDTWIVGKKSRRPNPVKLVASKARKLKTLLTAKLPHIPLYVDSCVVLTATPQVDDLPSGEARRVLSLSQAGQLGLTATRRAHLNKLENRIRTPSLWKYASEFDAIFGDRRSFRSQEASFDGFRIIEENVFKHPRGIWAEHRAEESDRTNSTALLRCWNFAALPPALNAPPERAFVAERERRVFDHLNALGSWLADGASILRPLNAVDGDIATDHFDLLALPATWAQVPRFAERMKGQMEVDDCLDVIAELLRVVAELHDRQIAHRDLGKRNVWLGGTARVGLTGFAICQLPSDQSVADWRTTLQAYAPPMPEDAKTVSKSNGFLRDVYQVGMIASEIVSAIAKDKTLSWVQDWLATATAPAPEDRFATARHMLDEFNVQRERIQNSVIDRSRLDLFESQHNPYAKWARLETISGSHADMYRTSAPDGAALIVKVWPGIRRNDTLQLDLALLRLFEGVFRLNTSPLASFPIYESAGLHAVGPFLVYRAVDGEPLELEARSAEEALSLAEQLLRAIQSLHALGYAHGDLSPRNILVSGHGTNARLTILDLFDLSPVGEARKRTPAFCPDEHESSTDQQLDRFAAALIAKKILSAADEPRLAEPVRQLEDIIRSDGKDPLEFAARSIAESSAKLKEPPARVFEIRMPNAPDLALNEHDFLVRRFDDDLVLTTDSDELTLTWEDGSTPRGRVARPSHRSLEDASANGINIKLSLIIAPGNTTGLEDLCDFLVNLPGLARPERPARSSKTRTTPLTSNAFPIREYWQRMIDIEDASLPELEITGEGEVLGQRVTFPCQRTRGNFDFDPDDTVDVVIGDRTKSIATLDLKSLDDDSFTLLREAEWPLKKGDRVRLVSRRSRQSFDRRRRAVDRILRRESEIRDLISYFDPSIDMPASTYDVDVNEGDFQPYKLNAGQLQTMLKVLRKGPIGLVQGPPGTGKTHFIAALVHWLTKTGKAEKILLVSQSHEGVNAALEKLIDRFKVEKNVLPLLRIGTKGISEKIRPYHTDSLRERFRASFEGALKQRVASAANGAGIPRKLAYGAVDIDRKLGSLSRRLSLLESINAADQDTEDARSLSRIVHAAQRAFEAGGSEVLGRAANSDAHIAEVAEAYRSLSDENSATPADMRLLVNLLTLSQNWLAALSTRHRNFDEFLARTRAIIGGTCVGVGQTSLRIDGTSFDWVIIDEAARCTSGELSVAAQLGRRVLLVGDHLQLLPMLDDGMLQELQTSFPQFSEDELTRSDFERAFASSYGAANHCVLSEQYRMVEPICSLVTDTFYRQHGVQLTTSAERLEDTRFSDALPAPFDHPIAWLDTSKDPRARELPNERRSHSNEAEAIAIVSALNVIASDRAFVAALAEGKEEKPIGIICMYGAQRDAIEAAIAERPWENRFRRLLKVETVDSYQGKENSIVIVSLSRTNDTSMGGHVSIPNRANVAFSRAKERLIIVGSSEFWSGFGEQNPIRKTLNWILTREQKKDGAAKLFDAMELFRR